VFASVYKDLNIGPIIISTVINVAPTITVSGWQKELFNQQWPPIVITTTQSIT